MDPEPAILFLATFQIFLISIGAIVFASLLLLVLLICSALVSGSEVAYFSLSPKDLDELEKEDNRASRQVHMLRKKPRKLLATILISNNFINIAIVILSDYLIKAFLGEEKLLGIGQQLSNYIPWDPILLGNIVNVLITIVGVTFLLVLFGEVAPKIYANLNNRWFSKMMAGPMYGLSTFFTPLSSLLVSWSTKMESKSIYNKTGIDNNSKEELDKAIQLTVDSEEESEDADILRGIIKFGNVSAKQIMKSRVDVIALEITVGFKEVMKTIKASGYSRIPVYRDDFDEIVGILYAKDLLGCAKEKDEFDWQQHIRTTVLYVPESKKIDDILKEFQKKRLHIAIVVDEFGGSKGIITLEDIFEEVIGEIKDEFDEDEEVDFIKIDNTNYIFEGKTLLHDAARIINVDKTDFDNLNASADSLAGLLLLHFGKIPKKDKSVELGNFRFKIVSASKKRIEKVHLTIL